MCRILLKHHRGFGLSRAYLGGVYVRENMQSSFSQVSVISPHGSHTIRRDNEQLPGSIFNEPRNTGGGG